MKLAEAANILGISLEDITLDSLKQTYKRLIITFENEKSRDLRSKHSYFQINEAYKKLTSVMEGKDNLKGDDQHEIAAFMRMFMDMVGMADADSIPSAMTFGMMFGAHQHNGDEWSTDDDGEGEYEEEEEDDEEDEDEDDDRNEEDFDDWPSLSELSRQSNWEPQAKQYSPMNLKDQVALERKENLKENLPVIDQEKRLKLAKKRAEKRKKQKEKKQKESNDKFSVSNDFEKILSLANSSESIERIVNHQKEKFKDQIFHYIENGNVEGIRSFLCFDSIPEIPQSILDRVYSLLRQEMPSYYLLHQCVTDFSKLPSDEIVQGNHDVKTLVDLRIMIADLFLQCQDPVLDLNGVNGTGLTVLHQSVVYGDLEFAKFIIKAIAEFTDRPITLNLNTRCRKKGWAPIHYAVEIANTDAIKLLAQAGANLLVTAATDRKLTPLELARSKIVQKNGSNKSKVPLPQVSKFVEIERLLNDLIAASKVKKSEKPSQEIQREQLLPLSDTVQKIDEKVSDAQTKKSDVSKSSEKKKKKAKKPSPPENSIESEKMVKSTTPQAPEQERKPNSPSIPSFEISVSSRDELVDNLLTMGFAEADCLAAVSRYGTDIDRAISWLCERPNENKSAELKADSKKIVPSEASSVAPSVAEQRKSVISVEEPKKITKATQGKIEEDRRKTESQKKSLDDPKKTISQVDSVIHKAKGQSKKDIRQKAISPEQSEAFPPLLSEGINDLSNTNLTSPTSSPLTTTNNSIYSIPVQPENLYYNSPPIQLPPGIPQPVYPLASHVLVPVYPMTPVLYGPPLVSVNTLSEINQNSGALYPGGPLVGNVVDRSDGFIDLEPDLQSDAEFVNNGTELSVGAKPFIPKLFTGLHSSPFLETSTLTGNETSSSLNNSMNSTAFGSGTELLSGLKSQSFLASLNSTALEPSIGGFASSGIWSSASLHSSLAENNNSISSPVSFDPFAPLSTMTQETTRTDVMPDYLSSILSGLHPSIGSQADPFEFDAARDILPDLDSLLSNDVSDFH